MALKKAILQQGSKKYEVMFNPSEYTYSQESHLSGDNANVQFNQITDGDFTVELLFDTYETGEDVRQATHLKEIVQLIQPTVAQGQAKEPPLCSFVWGGFSFTGVVSKIDQNFTLFLESGVPVRARVNLTLKRVMTAEEALAAAGIEACRKLWTVRGNDRLDLIAAETLGHSERWTEIAEHNNITDPFHFPRAHVGRTLVIPDR